MRYVFTCTNHINKLEIQGPESRKVRVRQLLACVGAPSDAKVPAGSDVDRLREITGLAFSSTAGVSIRTPGRASASGHHRRMALLQIHVVIDQDHLAHPGVIAGHVGLPDVGQDDGGVVEESHSEHQPLAPLSLSGSLSGCADPQSELEAEESSAMQRLLFLLFGVIFSSPWWDMDACL